MKLLMTLPNFIQTIVLVISHIKADLENICYLVAYVFLASWI